MNHLICKIQYFNKLRDWDKFHTTDNLIKSISIEAGELLELIQWNKPISKEALKEELADIFIYALNLCGKHNLNPEDIIEEKMNINARKYPIEKAKGNAKKYTEL